MNSNKIFIKRLLCKLEVILDIVLSTINQCNIYSLPQIFHCLAIDTIIHQFKKVLFTTITNMQGHSGVAQVLKCSIRGTNNQFSNIFYKKTFLMSNFCSLKIISFTNRRERLFMDERPQFQILNSSRKMVTCYLWDINKFLRYRALFKRILKCGFSTKGIKLTLFVLFEVL